MTITASDIRSKFTEMFRREPLMVRAPGRINLIGEHTDYNDGFVMPAAVDKEIFFAISPSEDARSVIYSLNYDETLDVNLAVARPVEMPLWANYLLGVLHKYREENLALQPFYCVFGGNVPPGAGMSSSAALECGFALAVSELNGLAVPKINMIKMAQWAEHNYVGVKCGIMDQYASVMGKKGNVIVLDCRTLEHQYAPLDLKGNGIVLCDTKVKHSLVDSGYNARRQDCEAGVKLLQNYYPSVTSLRDVTRDMLEEHRAEFVGKAYERCLYVVQEIERVQQATKDLKGGDLEAFGKKMFETHAGLSQLYEVSCPELDFLVEAARSLGVLGSRMMGGGFGGCTINILRNDYIDDFIREVSGQYKRAFDIDMAAYRVEIVDGVSLISQGEQT